MRQRGDFAPGAAGKIVTTRSAVRLTEEREFGIGHPKRFIRDVRSGRESRDPMMIGPFAWVRSLRPDGRTDEGEDLGLVEPLETQVLVDVPSAVVGSVGEVAGTFDGTEAEGGGGKALGGAVFGEGVEEGGGGAIGGLSVVTEEGGDGAEHEEEVEIREDVVEIPGALDLGRDDGGVLFVG